MLVSINHLILLFVVSLRLDPFKIELTYTPTVLIELRNEIGVDMPVCLN